MKYLKTIRRGIPITFFILTCQFTSAQQQQLHLAGDNDASLIEGSGILQIGETYNRNLVIDDNEILARKNGQNSTLFLNIEGGDVKTGKDSDPSNLWVTGYLRSGTSDYNPRFKVHYESGMMTTQTGIIPLNLPPELTEDELILIQLTTLNLSSGWIVPHEIGAYSTAVIELQNGQLPAGALYRVTAIYIDL